ncbi:hypothetical protein, conserved [Leishmania tarentolae]|uniref:Uncharacterized protein n=1 Tax=Leishmania tarentolae TaxID=5689 RepID=A0A640KAR0_LEITA|nr:hypothetical protein, conserved [Leishmania tarentolae]
MSASGTLEKLLPSLYEFLSVHPSDGHARSSAICSSAIGPDLPYTSLAVIADSYTRWRRCITVWRRVIGNDCVFLTLLLHAGCLWSPNYAALHRARRDIATRAEQQRLCAQRASASGDTLSLEAGHETAAREQGGNVRQRWATPTADAPHGTPVKRRGKRGGKVAAEAAAHSACALAAAAEAHAELAEMCPASTWALHVLHFLRVEEVCVVPCSSSSTAKSEQPSNTTRTNSAPPSCALEALHDGSGDSSESELSLRSGNSRTSRSGSQDSHSSNIESERTVGDETSDTAESRVVSTRRPAFGRGRCAARNRGGRGARQRGAKRQCGAERGQRSSASGGDNSRKKWCRHDGDASREARSPGSAPRMQWTASSSLLPRLSHKESDRVGGGKHLGSTLVAVLTLLQQQEQCHLSTRCGDRSVDTGAKGRDGALGHGDTQELGRAGSNTRDAGSKAFTVAHTTAEQKYAVLLRAVITLVSEEEPLVQQVATALVNEWLDLVSEETLTLPLRRTAENAPKAAKDDETACSGSSFPLGTVGSDGSAPRRRAALTGVRPSLCTDTPEQALRHRRVCEARHYWFSCLLKMVAYLDGIHSALREENAHISAVLARQGIAPQDAEDIFTKSLPAIFNCALVEEVLHSASTGSPASQASALSAWAAPSLLASAQAAANFRLWMPPPVLLLPFHLIGRESVLGVWIPASVASDGGSTGHPPAAGTSTRAQGRLVPCVVDSYGLHLGTEPLSGCGMQKPRSKSGGEKHASIVEAPRACKRASVGLRGQETAPRPLHPECSLEHSRLGFAMHCAESESLLEKRYLASLENLLPILCAPGMASQLVTDGDLRSDQPEPQSSTRWWPCTLSETAGSPRMDVYVARTLLMLPIPAQSTLDSSTDHAVSATRVDAGASAGACVVDGAHRMGTRTRNMLGVLASSSGSVRAAKKRPRGGFNRWSTMSAEEQAVRCQHPLLYNAMRVHLRADKFLSKAGSDASENGGAELVLLYGDPRGEEAIALRHMGFTVRTGSHHRLGRGSAASARRMGSSAVASVTELSSGASGGSGRLTLARDALGTTLEGMYLIARRVLGLQGLFVSSTSALTTPATAAAEARVGGKGRPSTTGAAAFEEGGPRASSKGTTTSVASFPVCAQTEREALGIAAATLALTCLVLSHSLLDDLLEQPSVVLWTTELASFIVDVSLLMPRPVPRLLKADGFALALLLQPAQSLLLMVGLAATLVIREVDMVAATHRDGEAGSVKGGGRWRGSSSAPQPVMSQWHPWWSAFRAAVLRDTELPSCLYSGIWAIVESAEGSLATFAAEVRRDTSGNRQAGDGRCRRPLVAGSDGRDDDAVAAAPANMSGSAGVGGGRRVLSLSVPSPPAAADRYPLTDAQDTFLSKSSDATPSQSSGDGAAPYRHRFLLKVPSAGSAREQLSAKTAVHHRGHSVACGEGSVVSARQSCTPRRLCGHAVLFQDDDASRAGSLAHDAHAAASLLVCADGVCVLSGSETALLGTSSVHAQAVPPVSRPLSLSLTGPTLLPRRTSAVASALWASLEAQEMRWSTGAA